MKTLIFYPSWLKPDRHERVARGEIPQHDYDALVDAIRSTPGGQADLLDFTVMAEERGFMIRLARRWFGDRGGLMLLTLLRCRHYDVVLSAGDPLRLAMLLALLWRRPRLIGMVYYFTARNAKLYRLLERLIDKIVVVTRTQYDLGRAAGIPESRLLFLESCGYVDNRFFESRPALPVNERQVCSAGRESRDYATLFAAMTGLSDITAKIDPGSPWSSAGNPVANLPVPANVEICQLPFGTIWRLYAESAAVVIPLMPNSDGGQTTLPEALAMGKPVIVTRAASGGFGGWADLIDGENVLLATAGDADDMRRAIVLLMGDAELRQRIGANGRLWAQKHAAREDWLRIMIGVLAPPTDTQRASAGAAVKKGLARAVAGHGHGAIPQK